MSKRRVRHEYRFSTSGLSDYGRVKEIARALEPLATGHDYGYVEDSVSRTVTIWWETQEEVPV